MSYIVRVCVLVGAAVILMGCAARQPEVVVLGVEESKLPRQLSQALVFVEVVNHGAHELELSRLDYQLAVKPWIVSEGSVELERVVAPHSSAIIEIPVTTLAPPVGHRPSMPFHLDGRLYARGDVATRSWQIAADGSIRGGRAQTVAVAQPARAGR